MGKKVGTSRKKIVNLMVDDNIMDSIISLKIAIGRAIQTISQIANRIFSRKFSINKLNLQAINKL